MHIVSPSLLAPFGLPLDAQSCHRILEPRDDHGTPNDTVDAARLAHACRRIAAFGAIALLVACATSPARAYTRLAVSTSGSVTAAPGGNPSMPIDTKDAYGPPTPSPLHAHVVATDSVPGASARMEAESTVGFGGFRGLATADATAELDFLGEAFAMVQASSNDEILIMPANPALVNSVATVHAWIVGSGNLEATNTGTPPPSPSQAGWSVTAQTSTGLTQGSVSGSMNAASGPYGDPPATYLLSFDVELGVPSQLAIAYVLMAETRYRFTDRTSGTGHAAARFGSTVTWGGIQEVLDAGGQPIAFSLDSASGTDWTRPVPEPGPSALGLCATAASGALARRARHRARSARRGDAPPAP